LARQNHRSRPNWRSRAVPLWGFLNSERNYQRAGALAKKEQRAGALAVSRHFHTNFRTIPPNSAENAVSPLGLTGEN